jgi:phage shock protein A
MAKLLKPLVVIVLVLAVAAVCIQGFVLFPKRTLIKDRTQKLEGGITRVVNTLKGEASLLTEEEKSQVRFSANNLKAGTPEELPRLDSELNLANTLATAVLTGWQHTQTDLENTRQDLENTKADLERTRGELEDARTQIVQLNDTIRSKDAELVEKSNLIAGLEDEKASLESQIAELNDRIGGLEDQVAQLEEENVMLENQLAKYEQAEAGTITMKPGTTASIIYANADWNFVIIDIGTIAGAQPSAEMIVHRNDNMVGKIRLSAVRDNVSIAEVLPEFQKDAIKEGDDVLF